MVRFPSNIQLLPVRIAFNGKGRIVLEVIIRTVFLQVEIIVQEIQMNCMKIYTFIM